MTRVLLASHNTGKGWTGCSEFPDRESTLAVQGNIGHLLPVRDGTDFLLSTLKVDTARKPEPVRGREDRSRGRLREDKEDEEDED